MADQTVVSVVALEVSDGKESEFLALTGQMQASCGTRDTARTSCCRTARIHAATTTSASGATPTRPRRPKSDSEIDELRRDLGEAPALDAARRCRVGRRGRACRRRTVAGAPYADRSTRRPCDRAERGVQRTGSAHGRSPRGSSPCGRADRLTFGAGAAAGLSRTSSTPRGSRASGRWRRSRISRSAPRIETTDGRIITGCNIENSTYGLTMCAERVAMFKAISEGHRSFRRIAVVADTSQPTTPCGACRQILWESPATSKSFSPTSTAIKSRHQLKDLLPHPFDARFIE